MKEWTDAVLDAVGENMSKNTMLTDDEKTFFAEAEKTSESAAPLKVWVDDVRPAPEGYTWVRSVNEFFMLRDENPGRPLTIDLDHDAGDYQPDGGDYVKILDRLEAEGAVDVVASVHSANPVGAETMRRIIRKNGWDREQVDEGVKELVGAATIAGLLSIPNVLSAKDLSHALSKVPRREMRIGSAQVQKAISDAAGGKMIGKLSEANTINAVARTIYAETKGEPKEGQDAVASVIWNRAGGDPARLVDVVSAKLQFSCWNKYEGGWTEGDFTYSVPATGILGGKKAVWAHCLDLAARMVRGDFEPTVPYNSYLNKATASKKAVNSWGRKCINKIGNHHFAYFAYMDGFKYGRSGGPKTFAKTYVVKPGDTLGKIAKELGSTVAQLVAKNGIKDPNAIRIG